MENLGDYKIEKFPLELKKLGDLMYHEGAFLSDFVDNNRTHHLYKWSDVNENYNRWMVFKVIIEDLIYFLNENLSLLELIEKNQFVYFIDLDNDFNVVNVFYVPILNVHKDYLPSKESYFDASNYEEYALTLKKKLEKYESI